MRKLFFILSSVIISFAASAQEMDQDQNCMQYREEALQNIEQGLILYKKFGLPVNPLNSEQLDYLRQTYHLEVKQMGCVVMPGEFCYNKEIEAYIRKKFSRDVHELIEEAQNKFPYTSES